MGSKKNKKNKKQRRPRRAFTEEFRADVVRLCQAGGESISEVAKRLDLTESAVRVWVKKAEPEGLDGGNVDGDALHSFLNSRSEVWRAHPDALRAAW